MGRLILGKTMREHLRIVVVIQQQKVVCFKGKCGDAISRGCNYMPEGQSTDQCKTADVLKEYLGIKLDSQSGQKCTACVCDKDDCNGAGMTQISFMGIAMAVI